MKAYPRERFSAEITLTPALVAAYAQAAGDTNPVHLVYDRRLPEQGLVITTKEKKPQQEQ